MEAKAIELFTRYCAPEVKSTIIDLDGTRFRVSREGRKIIVEPLKRRG